MVINLPLVLRLFYTSLLGMQVDHGIKVNLDNSHALGYNIVASNGVVAQLGERYNRTVEVEGSSPSGSMSVVWASPGDDL